MKQTKFIKLQKQRIMHQVCGAVGISTDYYKQYLKEAATDWLLAHLQDTQAVDDVMQCDVFWKWWYLQAYYRDSEWVENTILSSEGSRLLNDWMYFHSAPRLCDRQLKHAQLLWNGYANINWNTPNRPKKESTAYITATGLLTYNYN